MRKIANKNNGINSWDKNNKENPGKMWYKTEMTLLLKQNKWKILFHHNKIHKQNYNNKVSLKKGTCLRLAIHLA